MVWRPAFVDRFLGRFPDPFSLRVQALAWTGAVAGTFALLLVGAATQLDARRCAEVARVQAETLALTAGTWLDGDAHAGLGDKAQQRLSDLHTTLSKLVDASGYDGAVRTLRVKSAYKAELAEHHAHARPAAMEMVLQSGAARALQDIDYRPEMGAALYEGKVVSVREGGTVSAFAPVPDSWGSAQAIVWVEGPAVAPLWRRVAFPLGAALFAGLLVSFAVYLARRQADWLGAHAAALAARAQDLAAGRSADSLAFDARAPRELALVADALESLRERLAGGLPDAPPAAPAAAASETPARAALGEASEFELALLLQQLVDPARQNASARGVELQVALPENLPARVVGHPVALFRALDGLLRNSLRTTRKGRVTLRVLRTGEGANNLHLRFEVADTSPGIAFKEQQELAGALAAAALADPNQLKDSLEIASAFASALGSELTFESQPGQGSRFAFTAAFQGSAPRAPTAFQPRPVTSFQPRPPAPPAPFPAPGAKGLGPPISSFVPRRSIPLR